MQMENSDYKYSLGTAALYNGLFHVISNDNDKTDIILINIFTLIRNVISTSDVKNKSYSEIVKAINHEIKEFLMEVIALLQSRENILPKYIILYSGNYECYVPTKYLRPLKDISIYEDVSSVGSDDINDTNVGNNIHVIMFPKSIDLPIQKKLIEYIIELENNHNAVMISNHPLDYHISAKLNSWKLIQAFTGKIFYRSQLSQVVFYDNDIPFVEEIHVLLGDKVDVFPSLNLKDRRALLSLIRSESWKFKQHKEIIQLLSDHHYHIPYSI